MKTNDSLLISFYSHPLIKNKLLKLEDHYSLESGLTILEGDGRFYVDLPCPYDITNPHYINSQVHPPFVSACLTKGFLNNDLTLNKPSMEYVNKLINWVNTTMIPVSPNESILDLYLRIFKELSAGKKSLTITDAKMKLDTLNLHPEALEVVGDLFPSMKILNDELRITYNKKMYRASVVFNDDIGTNTHYISYTDFLNLWQDFWAFSMDDFKAVFKKSEDESLIDKGNIWDEF